EVLALAEREAGGDHRAAQVLAFAHAHAAIVEVGAVALAGGVQLVAQRVEYHRVDRHALFQQRDRHAEVGDATQVVVGAVQRVDHPGQRTLAGRAAFLGEDGVVGVGAAQFLDDFRLGQLVDLGDEIQLLLLDHVQAVDAVHVAQDHIACGTRGGRKAAGAGACPLSLRVPPATPIRACPTPPTSLPASASCWCVPRTRATSAARHGRSARWVSSGWGWSARHISPTARRTRWRPVPMKCSSMPACTASWSTRWPAAVSRWAFPRVGAASPCRKSGRAKPRDRRWLPRGAANRWRCCSATSAAGWRTRSWRTATRWCGFPAWTISARSTCRRRCR